MNEETQVNEQPTEEQVNLEGVEIVSNGEKVDVSTESKAEDNTEQDTPKEEPKAKEPTTEEKNVQEAKTEMEDTKKELSSKGIDYAKLEAEYNNNGKLSDESFKQLEEAGYPKAVVQAVIAGWQAKADAFVNKIVETAGGKREFSRIQKFVQEQGQEAIDTFNEVVEKSNLNVVSAYITGIKAQMVAKYGTSNPTLGGGNSSTSVSGYKDANEMVQAMSDPRYGKDIQYTKSVEDKVAKSTFF